MTVELNGEPVELPEGASVALAVKRLGAPERRAGVAVAVDGEVVPRAEWARRPVPEGARVEALTAMQGG
jgi:sulfur carrier protein